MEVPEIRYAKSGAVNIAYQRFGTGPGVVAIPPLVSNIEIMWEHEVFRRFLELRARHTRVLQFDKRGIGMSDRVVDAPTLEERIGDLVAVSATWLVRKPDDYFDVRWRRENGGGPILINLIHDIGTRRHLGGDGVCGARR